MNRIVCSIAASALTMLRLHAATAQEKKPVTKLDAVYRKSTIVTILKMLKEEYVFPEVGAKMAETVQARVAKKEYDTIDSGPALAEKLTKDLRAVSHDLHLHVNYSPEVLPLDSGNAMEPTKEQVEAMHSRLIYENGGVEEIKILSGNVGYIKLQYFADPEVTASRYEAMMNLVADTDALIFDLRYNGGSMSEAAIPLVCGYLFEKPTHINSIYLRPTGKTTDYYSEASVPGRRYLDKPVYVLTSSRTFSGAEEFAYDLKNLKRATIIGETTGGGANGGGTRRVNDHVEVWLPVMRAINPITRTNWEGVGVAPDMPVPAIKALHTAHQTALQRVMATKTEAGQRKLLQQTLREVEQNAPKLVKMTFSLKGYPKAQEITVAGTFNSWSQRADRLVRKGKIWTGEIEAEPGRHQYKFIVDGEWVLDPANKATATDGDYTNSVIEIR